jgi:hypothetical protein
MYQNRDAHVFFLIVPKKVQGLRFLSSVKIPIRERAIFIAPPGMKPGPHRHTERNWSSMQIRNVAAIVIVRALQQQRHTMAPT